jgi:UDP-N-acetylmuramoyl-L-alanyl-D-glutamate--2,6-diaminopimelate ligase
MNFRTTVKKIVPTNLFREVEPFGHWAEAILWNVKGGFPSKGLKVIGVTGTDGKTTTCTLITQMLRQNGFKVAMISTISVDLGDGKVRPNPTRLTTMGSRSLVAKMRQIKEAGAEWVVLETTSHALAQHRVWGVPYTVTVMTNIGHEHLDYHRTFERYRDAKKMLFEQCNRNHKGLQVGVINADDPSGQLFSRAIKHPITYGTKDKGDLIAKDIKLTPSGSEYTIAVGDDSYHIVCNLPGSFNVYNSLAVVGVGRALGLSPLQIETGIASLKSVEGRMTRVDEGQDFTVIVDYAHTKGRLFVVFGSAGRRDEEKRAQQGEIAGRGCDVVVATEEDDRDIDGREILAQIAGGAEKAGKTLGKDLFLVHDRKEAVRMAINMAKAGDIVLLLGKGHEKSILSNGPQAAELRHLQQDDSDSRRVVKHEYDEVTAARDALKKRPR